MDDQDNIRRFREKSSSSFYLQGMDTGKPYEEFAERNMTEAETAEAEKRLAEMGVTVVRRE